MSCRDGFDTKYDCKVKPCETQKGSHQAKYGVISLWISFGLCRETTCFCKNFQISRGALNLPPLVDGQLLSKKNASYIILARVLIV